MLLKKKSIASTLVAQQRMGHAQGPIALEFQGHVQNGFDLFFAEVHVADEIAPA